MTSKKGIVFGPMIISLIIGVVVVITFATGTSLSWDYLLCYTGAKFLIQPMGNHIGTLQNSGVEISSINLIKMSYTECTQGCSDDYDTCLEDPPEGSPTCSEIKTECNSDCTSDYDKDNPDKLFYSFSIEVKHNAAAETRVKVSVVQTNSEIWSGETSKMKRGDSEVISTDVFKESSGECAFVFKATPLDTTKMGSDWQIRDLNFCVSAD